MIILLGTTSEQKIEIARKFFSNKGIEANITSFAVNSGIDDQPLREELIVQGSINRAHNAIKNRAGEYDISVGFEGGMSNMNGLWYYICAVSIVDVHGRVHSGISRKNPIPFPVVQEVNHGAYFATVIRKFEKETLNENNEFKKLVLELINRTESFLEACDLAWVQYQNSSYFYIE